MKQTLSEELRRTLVAHSLEAPEPAASIEAVLSRTTSETADPSSSGSSDRAPYLVGLPRWTRSLSPAARISAIAAAAAAVLLGVAVVNTARTADQRHSAQSSAGGAPATAFGSSGLSMGSASAKAPGFAPDGGAAGNLPPGAAGCPTSGDTPGALTPITLTPSSRGHQLSVIATQCWRPNGDQDPSSVVVVDQTDPARRSTTLIAPAENLHVDFVYLDGNRVVVRAAQWAVGAGADRGAVFEYPFVRSADGSGFTPQAPQRYAAPCTAADVSVAALSTGTTGRFLLRITNSGYLPCVVEGYPMIGPVTSGSAYSTREPSNVPASGAGVPRGTAMGRAIVIVLNPGDPATSVVRAGPADCARLPRFGVSLEPVGRLGDVVAPSVWCTVFVQALAPGVTGHS